jgi:hypothetical protein
MLHQKSSSIRQSSSREISSLRPALGHGLRRSVCMLHRPVVAIWVVIGTWALAGLWHLIGQDP